MDGPWRLCLECLRLPATARRRGKRYPTAPLAGESNPSMCGLHPPLHLRWRDVFLVGGDGPLVAEGVLQRAGAVAVELVLQLSHYLPARRDGAREQLVH